LGAIYVVFMAAMPETTHDIFPTPTPAPPELIRRATELVNAFHGCFWFRHPEAEIRYIEDVRLVIHHLREYGDHRAWRAAQELHQCLSLPSSKMS
jgi:hypothetical protein